MRTQIKKIYEADRQQEKVLLENYFCIALEKNALFTELKLVRSQNHKPKMSVRTWTDTGEQT